MAPLHPEILYAQRSSESEAEKVRHGYCEQERHKERADGLLPTVEHHLLHHPGAGYPGRAGVEDRA